MTSRILLSTLLGLSLATGTLAASAATNDAATPAKQGVATRAEGMPAKASQAKETSPAEGTKATPAVAGRHAAPTARAERHPARQVAVKRIGTRGRLHLARRSMRTASYRLAHHLVRRPVHHALRLGTRVAAHRLHRAAARHA